MCKMTLHSTLVPLFSSSPKDPSMDVELVQKSAKSVLRYADLFVALLRPYFDGDYDVTSISPHLAYGAFMTGVVFLSFEMSTRNNPAIGPQISCDVHVQSGHMSHVKDIIRLLGVLCSHWNVLQSAVSVFRFKLSRSLILIAYSSKSCERLLKRSHLPSSRNFKRKILSIRTGWTTRNRRSTLPATSKLA